MMNDLIQSSNYDVTIENHRAQQEVQAAVILAKKFPRDLFQSAKRILDSCKRKTLAKGAMYAYPRGGQMITGPSIRLAEVLAQNWGNLDFGIRELEQKKGESTVQAFCWDQETNVRQSKTFIVKHERKARGKINKLEDSRDIYEHIANQGARRLRACILGIIPGDIVDDAVEQCQKTLETGHKEPIQDRTKKMVTVFSELGVSLEMIEERLGHKLEVVIETELVNLQKIFLSIRDGMSKREDWFKFSIKKIDQKTEELNEKFNKKQDVKK